MVLSHHPILNSILFPNSLHSLPPAKSQSIISSPNFKSQNFQFPLKPRPFPNSNLSLLSAMESFKLEKSTAMVTFRLLRNLAKLFRFVEFCAAMVLLAWLSSRAPLAVKASGDYLRRLSSAISSPVFVFFVGNSIVVALFANSGQLSRPSSSISIAVSEIYQELLSNTPVPPEIIENDDKPGVSGSEALDLRSENLEEKNLCEKVVGSGESEFVEDGMSNDEFRRTIEEFIAKQVKFRREECLSVVVHAQA